MTATTSTTRADQIATLISREIIKAPSPNIIFSKFLHRDFLDGTGALTKDYPVYTDLATAAGGTEGTDASETHVLALGTKVTASPTEGVLAQARITDRALGSAYGQLKDAVLRNAIQQEDVGAFANWIRGDIARLTHSALKKIETDALALLSGISTSVGTTTVALTITDLLTAIYQGKINEMTCPNQMKGFVLTPRQVNDLVLEAVSTSGGVGGSLWNSQAPFDLMNRKPDGLDGYAGNFLGYPVFEYANALKVLANSNADGVGYYGALADPNQTPEAAMAAGTMGFGAIVFNSPIGFHFDSAKDGRSISVTVKADYDVVELQDKNAVSIITLK